MLPGKLHHLLTAQIAHPLTLRMVLQVCEQYAGEIHLGS